MSLSVDIRHRFQGFELDVQFEAPGGLTALFGRSGSGKTTIVNAVAGLLRPDSGRISLQGEPLFDAEAGTHLPPHKRRVGYVFQEGRLFPHMTVRGNLDYGRRFSGHSANVTDTDRVVDLLGLADLLERRPGALSGGEKQRVAIGRALLSHPRLLLMDEPLASLDEARKTEILPYLESLRDEAGVPILYVSHSVAEVARLATTLVLLRDGRVDRAGPAEDLLADPDSVEALGVREAGAILTATVTTHHDDGLTELAIPGGALFLPAMKQSTGTRTRVRILAQDVILARSQPTDLSALNVLPVEVVALRTGTGPGVIVQLECAGDRLLARITRRSAQALELAPGATCYAVVKSVSIARSDIARV